MELKMILFLVLFPFVSALFFSLTKNNSVRKAITYISSVAVVGVSVMLALSYFSGGQKTLGFMTHTHETDMLMLAVEAFLAVLVIILSFKYKKYYVALLSVAQTALMFWYELFKEPESESAHIYVDNLTVIMVLIIAIVGTLITVYAAGYMSDYSKHHTDVEDRRRFFFAMLYVFIGAMFGLVFSSNLVWIYFFWEITSIVSFLLIGYTRTPEAISNGFKALWMNLLGGLGFAIAIVYLGLVFGVTDLNELLRMNGREVVFPVILIAFAALVKSAQLPFSSWLLGAMVAPTPSSALLHSATMVKAGVYMLLRLGPLMSGTYAGAMVSYIGGITFLAASMLAISVSDGKKVLAYSTISNLGLITACAGVGYEETIWSGILLLIFHAVSKSLLFQTVGAIENATGSRDIESMHGLVKRYPLLAWTLVIGIAGMYLAPFGMLLSKWAALKAFVDSGSIILVILICFGSATTLFYWTKWLGCILSSTHRSRQRIDRTHKGEWFSLFMHTALMIVLCFAAPFISKKVLMPYIQGAYGYTNEVLSHDNIVIMLIMLVTFFIVPLIMFKISKESKFKKADRYINGVNCGDQQSFVDSMGEPKTLYLSNWYLEDYFGEKKIGIPSVVITVIITVVPILIAMGGAVK